MIGARQLVNLAPSISGGRVGTTRATRYQLTGPNRRGGSRGQVWTRASTRYRILLRVRAAEEATPTSESGPVKAVEHTPKPVQNVEAIAENPPPYASKLSGFKVLVAGATGKTGKQAGASAAAAMRPSTRQLSETVFRHYMDDTIGGVHEGTRNLQIEMIRQFHLQQVEMMGAINSIVSRQEEIQSDMRLMKSQMEQLMRRQRDPAAGMGGW
eukprot:gene10877-16997_t